MTLTARTAQLPLLLLISSSHLLAQLSPATPSKEYMRLGGQVIAIENAPAPAPPQAPAVQLSPQTFSFGNQPVGTESAAQTLTITNSGNATLSITNLAVSLSAFTISSNQCVNAPTLNPQASCTVSITFTPRPQDSGPLAGTLQIFDNASTSPQTVSLSGTAVVPSSPTSPTPLVFVAVSPNCRAVVNNNAAIPITNQAPTSFKLAGSCGIPPEARAFALNVGVSQAVSWVNIYPTGAASSATSIINSDGRQKSVTAIVATDVNGSISAYASDNVSITLDVEGYFIPPASNGLTFHPVASCRYNSAGNTVGAMSVLTVPVPGTPGVTTTIHMPLAGSVSLAASTPAPITLAGGNCGLPVAAAYALNLTAVLPVPPATSTNQLFAYQTAGQIPAYPTVRISGSVPVANAAIVAADTNGSISVSSSTSTTLLIDVEGYFTADTTGNAYYPVTPCRIAQSLSAASPTVGTNPPQTDTVNIGGSCGIPSAGPAAYAMNATVDLSSGGQVNPLYALSYLSIWDDQISWPGTSVLNAADKAVTSNLAIVRAPADGKIDALAAGANTLLYLDLAGYFASLPAPLLSAVAATNITSTSATITWTTDQNSTSLVNYGTTSAYGSSSALNSNPATSHSVTLTGLTAGTTYNYAAVSANAAGALAASPNFTFVTSGSAPPTSTATYQGLDTTTQGTWTGSYGTDGYLIANDATNTPAYATVSLSGQSAWTWASPSSDPRALQSSSGSSTGIASTYYASSNFSINVNITDGGIHRVSLYLLDWDGGSRVETIAIMDATSHAVLNSQSFAGFNNGQYASWNISGNVVIQVTLASGENAVVAGIFFGAGAPSSGAPIISSVSATNITSTSAVITWTTNQASSSQVKYGSTTAYGSSSALNSTSVTSHSVPLTGLSAGTTYNYAVISGSATSANFTFVTPTSGGASSATYSGLDTTTQGAWSNIYGGDGYIIANGANNTPSYATVTLTGQSAWTWTSSTSDPRALQVSTGSSARIASTYYATSSFSINVNITGGGTHRVSLYLLDWDGGSRNETISIQDAVTHAVLNTQTFSGFQNGQYASWNISGNVLIQVTLNSGENAVVAGIFFGTASATPAPVISAVTATNISATSATITWTTDQASSSLVNYGVTTSYGSSSPINATLATSHSVTLTGLTAGMTYDYSVVSANASGVSSTSANSTFATSSSAGATATWNGIDTTSQGTWTGHYGANGYLIANDANTFPAYAATSLTGDAVWTFINPTTDPRALQLSSGSASRIASVFYSTGTSFNIDLNLTDGKSHRIALYLLDWDTTARVETITIRDATSNAVLNTQSFSSFQNGQYAPWTITGHVLIQVAQNAGINAVVAGIFID